MRQLECMIAWTPAGYEHSETRGRVEVGPWPDRTGWSRRYSAHVGACFSELHDMPEWERIAMLFIEFNTLVVRDGIDPKEAHRAFLMIDEYRERISPDVPGAAP